MKLYYEYEVGSVGVVIASVDFFTVCSLANSPCYLLWEKVTGQYSRVCWRRYSAIPGICGWQVEGWIRR